MSSERRIEKVDPAKVKKGDLLAFTYYTLVKEVQDGGKKLIVADVDNKGSEIGIQGLELVERSHSSDFFVDEEKVGKIHAAEILVGSQHRPFTVCFEKQDGSERVLRGRLIRPEPLLGRSMVEDLEEADQKKRLKQVDHRTIKFLIVDGVKYIVK